MEERYPDQDEAEGVEGTACHFLGSEALLGRPMLPVGATAPNGVILVEEVVEAATVYIEAVREAAGGLPLVVEHPVAIPTVHPECWGTGDCWWYNPARKELHVADLKYGWAIVEAEGNWQLCCYALGAMEIIRPGDIAPGIFDQDLTIVFHIIQPRPFHILGAVREWRTTGGELRGYANRLAHSAAAALGASPTTQTGKHCRYCRARHACPAAQKMALAAMEYAELAIPEEMDANALAIELRALRRAADAIEYRKTAVEAQIVAVIERGDFVPGWSVERGQGRAIWSKPAEEIFMLGELMGVDLRKEPVPITVAQAKKKLPPEVVKAYSSIPLSGAKLVPTENTIAARVFGAGRMGGLA